MSNQSKPWNAFQLLEKSDYLKRTAPDCSFVVGRAAGGPRQIASHKWILSEASPVFEAMLNGEFMETKRSKKIPLPDEDPETFENFLIFIYYGKLDSNGGHAPGTLLNHYKLADKYMCESLKSAIVNQFQARIDAAHRKTNNCIHADYDWVKAFEFAQLLKSDGLISATKKELESRVHRRNQKITKLSCIYDFGANAFNEFLKLLYYMDNERFRIVEIYAKVNRLAKSETDGTSNGEPTLRAMLQNIDLRNLTLKQFLDGPEKSNIYDLAEKHAALVEIVKNLE